MQLSPFWVTNHQSNADQPIAPKRNAVIPLVLFLSAAAVIGGFLFAFH